MRFELIERDGVQLLAPRGLEWPAGALPDCCGPGNSLAERLVPDSILGLRISPACFIHDWCWQMASPAELTLVNSIFLHNLMQIIESADGFWLLRWMRRRRALLYYDAVQDAGRKWWADE